MKKLYKDAGYEKAIDLQQQYEDATGKSIFDNEEIGGAAANCFHSGTWQVWNGDGVVDMVDIYQDFDDVKTPEGLIDSYKGLTKDIKNFVEKAEKYLSENGIGGKKSDEGKDKGGESAKSAKPKASGDIYKGGEKKPEAKSEPKSAASQYTANMNKGKKSKGSAAKPASKKTTKDVATGDPMIDGIVSTAFNFVKSGKKATTIPLPEDVPYSKIAKALNELGCQTAMSGEPDSKGYGIVVSPPKED